MTLTSDIPPVWADTQTPLLVKEGICRHSWVSLFILYFSCYPYAHFNFCTNLMVQTLTFCEPRGLCRPTGTFPLREVYSLGTQPPLCDCFRQSGNLVFGLHQEKQLTQDILFAWEQVPISTIILLYNSI